MAEMRVSPSDRSLDLVLENGQWLLPFKGRIVTSDGQHIYVHGRRDATNGAISYPFDSRDLFRGNSSWLLSLHSLSAVQLLLERYQLSGNTKYLTMAVEYTLAFSRYDYDEKFNAGFLNNDHAVAARVYVLSSLWRHYRDTGIYDERVAKQLVSYVLFLGNRLKKDSFYTYKTNHGTMQNIALMLLSTVFQGVATVDSYGELGLQRLEEQMGYLVSSEGFFLEHSLEYHEFFISILRAARNYFAVNKKLSSELVNSALQKAELLADSFVRSDGSIAAVGDTSFSTRPSRIQPAGNAVISQPVKVFAESGFSFLQSKSTPSCENKESFVTVFWSNFLNHGHKHWDDGSVDSYLCDTQWWRAAGYIPYWHPLRDSSELWEAANAPHLVDESAPIANGVKSIWQVNNNQLQYLRIERVLENNTLINREVYQLGPVIIVADFQASETPQIMQVYWTMSADKPLVRVEPDKRYVFRDRKQQLQLVSQFSSNRDFSAETIRADKESILGWVEVDKGLLPTTSLKLQSTSSTAAALLNSMVISPMGSCRPMVTTEIGDSVGDKLEVSVTNCGLDYTIKRDDGRIAVNVVDWASEFVIDKLDGSFLSRIAKIENKTIDSIDKYGTRFKPLYEYRVKVSWLGVVLFICCLVGYFLVIKTKKPWLVSATRHTSYLLWSGLIIWVHFFYFYS